MNMLFACTFMRFFPQCLADALVDKQQQPLLLQGMVQTLQASRAAGTVAAAASASYESSRTATAGRTVVHSPFLDLSQIGQVHVCFQEVMNDVYSVVTDLLAMSTPLEQRFFHCSRGE